MRFNKAICILSSCALSYAFLGFGKEEDSSSSEVESIVNQPLEVPTEIPSVVPTEAQVGEVQAPVAVPAEVQVNAPIVAPIGSDPNAIPVAQVAGTIPQVTVPQVDPNSVVLPQVQQANVDPNGNTYAYIPNPNAVQPAVMVAPVVQEAQPVEVQEAQTEVAQEAQPEEVQEAQTEVAQEAQPEEVQEAQTEVAQEAQTEVAQEVQENNDDAAANSSTNEDGDSSSNEDATPTPIPAVNGGLNVVDAQIEATDVPLDAEATDSIETTEIAAEGGEEAEAIEEAVEESKHSSVVSAGAGISVAAFIGFLLLKKSRRPEGVQSIPSQALV